ncbi:Uncharacterised protein [Mycobacteroides abscessus subsp. abscessus]|nr:Uncharacterised protein [Mycobacteroides abscessus subsp. abscessus]
MPIGRLIRKIQCQLNASISQPPRIGPVIGPSSIGTPSTAISDSMFQATLHSSEPSTKKVNAIR